MASAISVTTTQRAASAKAAVSMPARETTTDETNTPAGATTSMSEFCVPSALPREAAGMRSSMKNPSSADIGPDVKQMCIRDRICAVPQVMFGVLGGAVLDRFNRRDVSIASDIISALSVALLPVVDLLWGLNFAWFAVLGVLGAIGDIPGMTARDTLAPAVSRRDGMDLQRYLGSVS